MNAERTNNVLIVEDEPDLRLLTRLCLETAGYTVHEAPDGAHALDTLHVRTDIDILMLDLGLPDMTGWDVLDDLRRSDQLGVLRIIIFSAHVGADAFDRAVIAGATGFLAKPFTPEELLSIMASAA